MCFVLKLNSLSHKIDLIFIKVQFGLNVCLINVETPFMFLFNENYVDLSQLIMIYCDFGHQ